MQKIQLLKELKTAPLGVIYDTAKDIIKNLKK